MVKLADVGDREKNEVNCLVAVARLYQTLTPKLNFKVSLFLADKRMKLLEDESPISQDAANKMKLEEDITKSQGTDTVNIRDPARKRYVIGVKMEYVEEEQASGGNSMSAFRKVMSDAGCDGSLVNQRYCTSLTFVAKLVPDEVIKLSDLNSVRGVCLDGFFIKASDSICEECDEELKEQPPVGIDNYGYFCASIVAFRDFHVFRVENLVRSTWMNIPPPNVAIHMVGCPFCYGKALESDIAQAIFDARDSKANVITMSTILRDPLLFRDPNDPLLSIRWMK
ncbi:hypothetical protein POM88_036593 [Heracleum sosnowskyi]|uniref:Uncharacterized protein n=1 Tax=Heracleum sosnowskyi TaxID=360622 RepID=A0AAD8MEG4_9APIA|nr:hypothetical protein POM88_036593 [Heracleum sosnowskyi]